MTRGNRGVRDGLQRSGLRSGRTTTAVRFDGWTKAFSDPRLCAATADRLTFNGTIIETGTGSGRPTSARARAEETAKAG